MRRNSITIKASILIHKSREIVWDYTQNYDHRTIWDSAVLEATVLQDTPNRIVKLKTRGKTTMTFIYKLDDRPNKTTLVAKDIISPLIVSAGGSWNYAEQNGGTLWSQTNTITFKSNFLLNFLVPVYKRIFIFQTKKSMKKVKREIENPG